MKLSNIKNKNELTFATPNTKVTLHVFGHRTKPHGDVAWLAHASWRVATSTRMENSDLSTITADHISLLVGDRIPSNSTIQYMINYKYLL